MSTLTTKNLAYLGLGTNMGDRHLNLTQTREAIDHEIGNIITESTIYETKAWGITNQADFLNQVILIETQLLPLALINKVLELEKKLGRIRKIKWGERIIDIDLLFFNDWHFHTPSLQVPHPLLQIRSFVLDPLNEIASDFVHPKLGDTISELKKKLDKDLQ